jgi:chromosome segregation ATPase
MNEEPTKDLPNRSSFEERVFARFDAVDARLEKLESRAYDTKPIWERALTAIMDMGLEMGEVKNKVTGIENRVAVIESDVASIKTDYAEMKRDLKHQVNRRIELILEFLLEGRDDLHDAEERIKQLETKLA